MRAAHRCPFQGVAEKLQRCLKTHEELVQGAQFQDKCRTSPAVLLQLQLYVARRRLCQRNELLQATAPWWTGRGELLVRAEAHVRNARCDGMEACARDPCSTRGTARHLPCPPGQSVSNDAAAVEEFSFLSGSAKKFAAGMLLHSIVLLHFLHKAISRQRRHSAAVRCRGNQGKNLCLHRSANS